MDGKVTITYTLPTVSFNANGGSGSMADQVTNTPTALTANEFTRAGYDFDGWNTASSGSGIAYADGATYAFDATAVLYAQWTAVPAPVQPSPDQAAPETGGPAAGSATDLQILQSAKTGQKLKPSKKQTLVKAVVRNAGGQKAIRKVKTKCSAPGAKLSAKACGLKARASDDSVAVKIRPKCSVGLKVRVVIKAQAPSAASTTWKSKWNVKPKPRISCS